MPEKTPQNTEQIVTAEQKKQMLDNLSNEDKQIADKVLGSINDEYDYLPEGKWSELQTTLYEKLDTLKKTIDPNKKEKQIRNFLTGELQQSARNFINRVNREHEEALISKEGPMDENTDEVVENVDSKTVTEDFNNPPEETEGEIQAQENLQEEKLPAETINNEELAESMKNQAQEIQKMLDEDKQAPQQIEEDFKNEPEVSSTSDTVTGDIFENTDEPEFTFSDGPSQQTEDVGKSIAAEIEAKYAGSESTPIEASLAKNYGEQGSGVEIPEYVFKQEFTPEEEGLEKFTLLESTYDKILNKSLDAEQAQSIVNKLADVVTNNVAYTELSEKEQQILEKFAYENEGEIRKVIRNMPSTKKEDYSGDGRSIESAVLDPHLAARKQGLNSVEDVVDALVDHLATDDITAHRKEYAEATDEKGNLVEQSELAIAAIGQWDSWSDEQKKSAQEYAMKQKGSNYDLAKIVQKEKRETKELRMMMRDEKALPQGFYSPGFLKQQPEDAANKVEIDKVFRAFEAGKDLSNEERAEIKQSLAVLGNEHRNSKLIAGEMKKRLEKLENNSDPEKYKEYQETKKYYDSLTRNNMYTASLLENLTEYGEKQSEIQKLQARLEHQSGKEKRETLKMIEKLEKGKRKNRREATIANEFLRLQRTYMGNKGIRNQNPDWADTLWQRKGQFMKRGIIGAAAFGAAAVALGLYAKIKGTWEIAKAAIRYTEPEPDLLKKNNLLQFNKPFVIDEVKELIKKKAANDNKKDGKKKDKKKAA